VGRKVSFYFLLMFWFLGQATVIQAIQREEEFFAAVNCIDVGRVKMLLSEAAAKDKQTGLQSYTRKLLSLPNYPYTALGCAVRSYDKGKAESSTELVKMLLEAGADANEIKTVTDYPPLWWAVFVRILSVVKLLLQFGANINYHYCSISKIVYTPLRLAIRTLDVEMAKLLISWGASLDIAEPVRIAEYPPLAVGETPLQTVQRMVGNCERLYASVAGSLNENIVYDELERANAIVKLIEQEKVERARNRAALRIFEHLLTTGQLPTKVPQVFVPEIASFLGVNVKSSP